MPEFESSVYTAFEIRRIKEIYFSINEELLLNSERKLVKFEVEQTFGANDATNLINLTLRVFIHYSDSKEIIADIKVQNIFFVPQLNKHVEGERLKLPKDTIVSMVSVGIAHSRALLAKNLSGTTLESTILPVVNPLVLSQHLFPNIFDDTGLEKEKAKAEILPAKKTIKTKPKT